MNQHTPNRFIKQSDGILDTHTGLVWTADAAISEFPLTWAEALDFVQDLNRDAYLGHGDWKLSNRRELFSLMSHKCINPSLPAGHPFTRVFTGYYWTSTTCVRLPDQAWYIHLGGAKVYKGMKHQSYMVWPVRPSGPAKPALLQTGQTHCYDAAGNHIDCTGTGQDAAYQVGLAADLRRFSDQGEVVCDSATGLTWLKTANPAQEMVDWKTAFDWIREMNRQHAHGYNDWRLPEINELESLTHMGTHSPALPPDHPFTHVQDFYWSATRSMYDTRYAWVLYARDGYIGVGHTPQAECYIWPVRGV
ncbi:MAG: DUF1566 domain-containing protein [Thermodesulfobacteriota bacterium]|nr:DUF1566 domain-containing protein [Thermodesulfobacteriota bacterium]